MFTNNHLKLHDIDLVPQKLLIYTIAVELSENIFTFLSESSSKKQPNPK